MNEEVIIQNAGAEDLSTIQLLAQQIWPATYGHLMSAEKLQYMLALIYSLPALEKQMQQGHSFLLVLLNKEPVGFASFSTTLTAGVYKLHKIYVKTAIQGKGLGRGLIDAVINELGPLQATALMLNVKRDNPAKTFYEKLGFVVTGEEDIDIGNGYFMNDYVMKKQL